MWLYINTFQLRLKTYTGVATVLNVKIFAEHPLWDENYGWKNILNNLRLIVQPLIFFNLIKPWLKVFPIPQLSTGFSYLISIMNTL